MKKVLLTTMLLTLAVTVFWGQDSIQPTRGYFTASGADNWFVSVGGGVQIYFGEDDGLYMSADNLAPAIDLSFGRWVAPSLGFRVQLAGLQGRGWSIDDTPYAYEEIDGLFKEKFYYVNARVDFLWNLLDMGNNYNYYRTLRIIPFVGVGAVSTFYPEVRGAELGVSGTLGLILNFRLVDAVSLNLEVRSTLSHGEMDKVIYTKEPYDINFNNIEYMNSATIGVQIEIKPKRFDKRVTVEQGYRSDISALSRALIENEAKAKLLNDKNVELNERCYQMIKDNELLLASSGLLVEELESKPKPVVEIVEKIVEVEVPVELTIVAPIEMAVFFAAGSSSLTDKDKINLKYLCTTIMSGDEIFTITPYADNSTGSRSVNIAIAKKRGQTVLYYLLECGVERRKLELLINEFNAVPFNTPTLNRCVVVRSK